MNERIGKENLPNVYIDKIVVDDQFSHYNIEVFLSMYDFSKTEDRLWFKRRYSSDIFIKIAFIQDDSVITRLNGGVANLFDFDDPSTFVLIASNDGHMQMPPTLSVSKINYKTTFRIDKTPIIPQEDLDVQAAFEAGANPENLYKFYENISNLNIYASTILRNDLFANNKTFNKFCGPMVGEVVYISGLINSRSNYFFDPVTNQEYSGPVHLHPSGRYMEGSEHSESPHKTLRLVEEENYKIILPVVDNVKLIPARTRQAPEPIPADPTDGARPGDFGPGGGSGPNLGGGNLPTLNRDDGESEFGTGASAGADFDGYGGAY